jgi:DNA-binding IclR family transcriptional regulator
MNTLKTPSVPALEKALNIMEVLAASRHGMTLSDLTLKLQLPKSSIHCILLTLERLGYLHRNQKGRYMFGLKLFSLANSGVGTIELRDRVNPYLRELMLSTGLTVHMAILEQGAAVLVAKVEAQEPFRLATWIGKRMDLHCTGVGKALMAFLPEKELESIQLQGLPRHNESTIISSRKLKQELALIRLRGYALDDEEDEIGRVCIGAPVFDYTGRPVAGISVAGTIDRIRQENFSCLVDKVKRTASAISRHLGYEPPPVQIESGKVSGMGA